MEDQAIITLFNERSEQAITELIRKYGGAVRSISGNILKDPMDAEEAANDVYLRVWNAIPPEVPKSLKAYVCAIARNAALNRYHSNTAQKRNSIYDVALEELGDCIPADGDIEEALEAKELSRHISAYLRTLPYDDRYLFVRRYYYAESAAQIGETMHLSANHVSVRLFRIRAKLHQYLKKEGMLP